MIREAVRALVLDPNDRILLCRFVSPDTKETWWATPGGGLEGEAPDEALRRELNEETGLTEFETGPPVWTRCHSFVWEGAALDQRETFFFVRGNSFEPRPSVDLAAEMVDELRWWTLEELEESREKFAPRRLAVYLRALLEQGPPTEPVDVGV